MRRLFGKFRRLGVRAAVCACFGYFLLLSIFERNPIGGDYGDSVVAASYEGYELQQAASGVVLLPPKLPSCVFPELNPFDEILRRYIRHPRKLICNEVQPNLVSLDVRGYLHKHFEGTEALLIGNLTCSYREIGGCFEPNRNAIQYGPWMVLEANPTFVPFDQFEVRCWENAKDFYRRFRQELNDTHVLVYRNAFLQIGPRPRANFSKSSESRLSVDILVLESISWNQFRRHFPTTWRVMQDEMGFIFFQKHGKTDDNTLVNLIPILTGRRLVEHREDNLTDDFPQKRPLNADRDFPFLWKDFSRRNCVTFLNDDPCHPARGFMYYPRWLVRGFNRSPTDYYFRAGHSYHRRRVFNREPWKKQTKHCRENTPYHEIILRLSEQFIKRFADTCHFSISSSLHELMHDSPVDGELMDEDLASTLARLNTPRVLNHTVLVVLGDHGHRLSSIKRTFIGQIEERTSLLAIRLPDWFRRKHHRFVQVLMDNTKMLTNHFDLYETIRDIVDNRLDSGTIEDRPGRVNGQSLFQPISSDRNCSAAGIPSQFCVCLESLGRVDANDSGTLLPLRAAISTWLRSQGYTVQEIHLVDVQRFTTNEFVRHNIRHFSSAALESLRRQKEPDVEFIQVTAKLKPGKSRWIQAQVQHTKASRTFTVNGLPVVFDGSNL